MRNPMEEPDDWGLDLAHVRKHLREWDTGRWAWEQIDCCWTGKNADLDPWGQQGVQLVTCNEDGIEFLVHGGKTETGWDVCLNEPGNINLDEMEAYREKYLDLMGEIVCGTNSTGEWDGDSWWMTYAEPGKVAWVYESDGVTPNYEATAQAVLDKAQEMILPWQREMEGLSHIANQLCGWENEDGSKRPDGNPGPQSVFADKYPEQEDA